MNLDDTIKHYENKTKEFECLKNAETVGFYKEELNANILEYKQMVRWLKELKGHRKAKQVIKQKAMYYAGQYGDGFSKALSDIENCVNKSLKGGN